MTHLPSHAVRRSTSGLDSLRHAIEQAAHLLPSQGPLKRFVHHNTLHALEDLPFDEAVKQASRIFGCHVYPSEVQFHRLLVGGRIRLEDLAAVLREDLGEHAGQVVVPLDNGTRFDLRLAMLRHPLPTAPEAELRWLVAETDALDCFPGHVPVEVQTRLTGSTRHWALREAVRDGWSPAADGRRGRHAHALLAGLFEHFGAENVEHWPPRTWEALTLRALWRICRAGVHGVRVFAPPAAPPLRHRDWLLHVTGEDSDQLVHDVLIRFCGVFVDQGLAAWSLPDREAGFYRAFLKLNSQPFGPPDRWLRGLRREVQRLDHQGIGPLESIRESLDILEVRPHEEERFLTATLLALRGWAGMLRHLERNGPPHRRTADGCLAEFLAVRLILERLALAYVARQTVGWTGPLNGLRSLLRDRAVRTPAVRVDQRALVVFHLAQLLGWEPAELHRLTKPQWSSLVAEMEAFPGIERQRLLQLAYERRYREQTLDAVFIAAARAEAAAEAPPNSPPPVFQAVFCIDEREESFRRHLEEVQPRCETFGTAGFFNVAMYYHGLGDADGSPLCPVVVQPRHCVVEQVVLPLEDAHRRRTRTRRVLAAAMHWLHCGSRTIAGGAVIAGGVGIFAAVPLVARVLFPRLTARLRRHAGGLVRPPRMTRLQLARVEAPPGPDGLVQGFTLGEMAEIVARVLRDLGLTGNFARLVLMVGHGSSSLNNPHESAHDCGACGGGRGGPNARAFAQMANDPRVRRQLAEAGLVVPEDTVFLGAYHNTCDESLEYFDLDRLPDSHRADFLAMQEALWAACARNAHERCRRFESAPLSIDLDEALRHVEARAEDLAQVRPEYGHATNAVCMVGRRRRTRGLFMDRRAFLTSYDPDQDDPQASILARVLAAVVPVCAGINLEYYFSVVDATGWGCGTKLPHNISGLVGVMDGAASDLRTGLPWQMVEIHEPVRLLIVVEARPEVLRRVVQSNAGIARLCDNGWVHLAALHPDAATIHLYRQGRFEPYTPRSADLPRADNSRSWYHGCRDHLGYALVESNHKN